MPQPQLLFGPGSISRIAEVVAAVPGRRILLVTGRASYRDSGAEPQLNDVLRGIPVVRYSDFSPNPTLQDVERGACVCRPMQPDVVVAVGGGSAIDTAKAIALFAAQEATPANILARADSVRERPRPIIAVPTTAGSGSEATRFATIYVDEIKHSLSHEWLRP